MPCESGYLRATNGEVEMSRVACLLDELAGKKFDPSHWDGYHPAIYCKGRDDERDDRLVAKLCEKLQSLDVKDYSLEMQIWWRDHQKADKLRVEEELRAKKDAAARKAAIEKLSDYERKLLGVEEEA